MPMKLVENLFILTNTFKRDAIISSKCKGVKKVKIKLLKF